MKPEELAEEIADARALAKVKWNAAELTTALTDLRSRRGMDSAIVRGLL